MKKIPLGTLILHKIPHGPHQGSFRTLLVIQRIQFANVRCLTDSFMTFNSFEIWPENMGYYEQFPDAYTLIFPPSESVHKDPI